MTSKNSTGPRPVQAINRHPCQDPCLSLSSWAHQAHTALSEPIISRVLASSRTWPSPPLNPHFNPTLCQVLSGGKQDKWYCFLASWLRSKCSICSYQHNIWYVPDMVEYNIDWFLEQGKELGIYSTFAMGGSGVQVLLGINPGDSN